MAIYPGFPATVRLQNHAVTVSSVREHSPNFGVTQPTFVQAGPLNLGLMKRQRERKPVGHMRGVLSENLDKELERAYPDSRNRPATFEERAGIPRETTRRILRALNGTNLDILEQVADALDIQTYKLLVPSERIARRFQPEDTTVIRRAPVFEDRPAVLHSNKQIEDAASARRSRRSGRVTKKANE